MLRRVIAMAVGLALVMGLTISLAAQPQYGAAANAVEYIKTLQNDDGGFPAFGTESSPGSTIDALFALIAAGVDPAAVTSGGNSPADYLEAQAAEFATDPGSIAKMTYGVQVAGRNPADFGGLDLITLMNDVFESSRDIDVFDAAFHVFARSAAGLPRSAAAEGFLLMRQLDDGGWEFDAGFESDSNTTAMALQALLVDIVVPNPPHVKAIDYLKTVQNPDGGFGFFAGTESDPNSTALVIQALVAAGEDVGTGGPWARDGRTPMEALLSFQNPETGGFQYGGQDSAFATYQAVPALMLAPFPDLRTREVREPTPQAPTAIEVTKTATPTVVIGGLPDAGGGAREGRTPWWAIAALVGGGAAAIGAGAAGWRSR